MRFLQKNTPFTPTEAADLISRFEPHILKENEYFLKAGMPVHKIGYLSEGILRRYIIDGKGKELIRQFITENHFFTDLDGFYLKTTSSSYIQSVTPCHIFMLSTSELEILKEEEPRLKLVISQIAEQNLLERIKCSEFLQTGSSAEKYHYFITHFPHLAQRVPLKYIASHLGMTQQSLSRIRGRRG
jgi:CRP-like cAMP-binding protein